MNLIPVPIVCKWTGINKDNPGSIKPDTNPVLMSKTNKIAVSGNCLGSGIK